MTIRIKVLTPKGVDINDLIDHAKHGDPEPHGSSRFDLEDRGHNLTLHAKGSGFKYIGDIPTSGSIRELVIDKGSKPVLDVDLSSPLKVSTVLSGSGLENFFKNQPYELKGNDGNDKIRSGWKSDELEGRDGNDYLDGNRGNDTIDGGKGNDRLIGNKGNDVLIGGAGKDVMSGGTGHDRFVFEKLSDSKVSAPDTILNFSPQPGRPCRSPQDRRRYDDGGQSGFHLHRRHRVRQRGGRAALFRWGPRGRCQRRWDGRLPGQDRKHWHPR